MGLQMVTLCGFLTWSLRRFFKRNAVTKKKFCKTRGEQAKDMGICQMKS